MLGSWIDHQGFKPDIVSVTGGAQMKDPNLFAATNILNLPLLKTSDDITQPFNPQMLTTTSSATSACFNPKEAYIAEDQRFATLILLLFGTKPTRGETWMTSRNQ
jgi:hypothetical protein